MKLLRHAAASIAALLSAGPPALAAGIAATAPALDRSDHAALDETSSRIDQRGRKRHSPDIGAHEHTRP